MSPSLAFTRISREYFDMHGLNPTQGSVLPDTSFTHFLLPGNNLDKHWHFYRIEIIRWDGAADQAGTLGNPERLDEVLGPSGGRKQPLRACGEFGDGDLPLRCGNDSGIPRTCAYGYRPIKGRLARVDITMDFGRIDGFSAPDLNTWPSTPHFVVGHQLPRGFLRNTV